MPTARMMVVVNMLVQLVKLLVTWVVLLSLDFHVKDRSVLETFFKMDWSKQKKLLLRISVVIMLVMIPNWYHADDFEKATASLAQKHHEMVINLLKNFGILKNKFESAKKHSACFCACCFADPTLNWAGCYAMFDIADTYETWTGFSSTLESVSDNDLYLSSLFIAST